MSALPGEQTLRRESDALTAGQCWMLPVGRHMWPGCCRRLPQRGTLGRGRGEGAQVARKRITGVGVGGPLGSASLSWEYTDDPAGGLGRGCLVLPGGRLPKVREVSDPVMLGVHPSSSVRAGSRGPAGEPLLERVPAYVPRDVDDELQRRLAVSGFVLIVGDSTAGKSRAASEAIAVLPDHVGYRPLTPSGDPGRTSQHPRAPVIIRAEPTGAVSHPGTQLDGQQLGRQPLARHLDKVRRSTPRMGGILQG